MLIPSHRHTTADLELWAEMEEADRVWYKVGGIERKAVVALESIREFHATGDCYLSVSWGKDSTAVAHLASICGCTMPFVRFRSDEDKYPHDDDVRDAFRSIHSIDYREYVVTWPNRGPSDWAKRNRLAESEMGTGRRIVGVRAAESKQRRWSAAIHGIASANSCRPLLRWTTADVFAYLAVHELPVHPTYGMLGGGRWQRDALRVSGLGGRPGATIGRVEHEREYYGDVLRRLETSR